MANIPTFSVSEINTSIIGNDSFVVTMRGRQDAMMDSRLGSPFGLRHGSDLSFPVPSTQDQSLKSCAPLFVSDERCSVPVASSGMTAPVAKPIAPCASDSSFTCKRRVNFAGQKVINDEFTENISEEELCTRWWTPEDLDKIKYAAKEMSLRLRRMAKEKGCCVDVAHKKTSLMLSNNFKELVKLSPSTPDQDLRHWCVRSDGRRGLERFASKEYGNARKEDVNTTRDAVFREQERQRQNNVVDSESLATVSKEKSRRARTFSLFMGEADAKAAARSVTRTSSKRAKVMTSPLQQPKSKHPRHNSRDMKSPPSSEGSFASVDMPLLESF